MMLTTKGRYAVMAVLDMALHENGAPLALSNIAERQNIPLNYLEQIFVRLRKSGLITSVRGSSGGYLLQRLPREITIDQIIDSAEEDIAMTRCKSSVDGCIPGEAKCKTHDLWAGLEKVIRNYFKNISLQNIMNNQRILFVHEGSLATEALDVIPRS